MQRAGRRCMGGDFAEKAADSTSSPYTYWGSTRCPLTVAAGHPTIIGHTSSLCGT
jgi:hypothetical protein